MDKWFVYFAFVVQEHELPNNFSEENIVKTFQSLMRLFSTWSSFVTLCYSSISWHVRRITKVFTEGHEHKESEELKLETLKTRIDAVTDVFHWILLNTGMEDSSSCDLTIKLLLELRSQLQEKGTFMKTVREMKNRRKCFDDHWRYACLKVSAKWALRLFLDSLILLKNRAIEIQTSDAGPGLTPTQTNTNLSGRSISCSLAVWICKHDFIMLLQISY